MPTEAQIVRSHLMDDFEKLRTGSLRATTSIDGLLSTALEALAAGDLHIVQEYVERAQAATAAEACRLRTFAPCSCCVPPTH